MGSGLRLTLYHDGRCSVLEDGFYCRWTSAARSEPSSLKPTVIQKKEDIFNYYNYY